MFPYTIQVLVVRYKSMANVNHIHDANNVTQKIFDHEPRKIQFEKQILFINKQTNKPSRLHHPIQLHLSIRPLLLLILMFHKVLPKDHHLPNVLMLE